MRDRFDDAAAPRFHPLTFLLIAVCVVVALLTKAGEDHDSKVYQALLIEPSFPTPEGRMFLKGLPHVRRGEVWRLVTPMFLHFGPLHLVFNMLMLHWLGGQIEARRGPLRYALLILAFAAPSNLAQYYLGHPEWVSGLGFSFRQSPSFGGMSGALYGLFGYAWMKARFEPQLGLVMPPSTVFMLIAWYALCFLPGMPVANMAHSVGLILGVVIGVAPHLWRSLRGRA